MRLPSRSARFVLAVGGAAVVTSLGLLQSGTNAGAAPANAAAVATIPHSPSCISAPVTSRGPAGPQESGYVAAEGDYVHVTSNQASGHGWWDYVNGDDPPAGVTVTVQLQADLPYPYCGGFRDVGSPGKGVLKREGGGGGNRITAKVNCASTTSTQWRSVVSAVVNGAVSSVPSKTTTTQTLDCSP